MAVELEIGVDPLLERGEPQLLEPVRRGLRPGVEGELGQRGPAPEPERLAQRPRLCLGVGATRLVEQALEAHGVDSLALDVEDVAGRARLERAGAEQPAQLRNGVVQRGRRRRRRPLAPELVDQAVGRNDSPGVEQQDREQRPLPLPRERERALVTDDLERPEQPKLLHTSTVEHTGGARKGLLEGCWRAVSERPRPGTDPRTGAIDTQRHACLSPALGALTRNRRLSG